MNREKLNREILKWFQTLDLAYSIKNPKRDFSNGYLMAEIFSRYYDKDIQMHSYDNGSALTIKQDNWKQLIKFFKKKEIPFDETLIDDIIHCKSGTIVIFINNVYTLLTQRRVLPPPEKEPDYEDPPFARPTAANIIHNRAREPDLTRNVDLARTEEKLSETLELHEKSLQDERILNPERFNPIETSFTSRKVENSPKIMRGHNSVVGIEENDPKVSVKQVQVKSIERNLRPTKDKTITTAGGSGKTKEESASTIPSVTLIINKAVSMIFEKKGVFIPNLSFETVINNFSSGLQRHFLGIKSNEPDAVEVNENIAIELFNELMSANQQICDSILYTPKDFSLLFTFIASLIKIAPVESDIFNAIINFSISTGKNCVEQDSDSASDLFIEFSLNSLSKVLNEIDTKRHPVLRIVYSFFKQNVDEHIHTIHSLKNTIENKDNFICCLSICIFMESELSGPLLDLYVSYCLVGMENSNPSVRAASLTMLNVIAGVNVNLIVSPGCDLLSKILHLIDDNWWEVQIQLLIVSASVLNNLPTGSSLAQPIFFIVNKVLTIHANPIIKKLGLCYLAKIISAHYEIAQPFVKVLLSFDKVSQELLLHDSSNKSKIPLPVKGCNGTKYYLTNLMSEWEGVKIATALGSEVKRCSLDHFEIEHLQILLASLSPNDKSPSIESKVEDWAVAFASLQDYIFVALCDPLCVNLAAQILKILITKSSLGVSILKNKRLAGALQLIFPGGAYNGDMYCQEKCVLFYKELWSTGISYRETITKIVNDFNSKNAERSSRFPLLQQLVRLVEDSKGK